jgi:proteasome lid subunit RPN8/RPN11
VIVPASVLDAVREHAAQAEDGFEVCGRLVVIADRVLRYDRGRNAAREPLRALPATSWKPGPPDERSIPVHSHPVGDAQPSTADLAWAAQRSWWRTTAIYSVRDDALAVWEVATDETFAPVEIEFGNGS